MAVRERTGLEGMGWERNGMERKGWNGLKQLP